MISYAVRLPRRLGNKWLIVLPIVASFSLCIVPATLSAQVYGGELVYAQNGSPPTLDPMSSSSALTRDVSMNIFEMLWTRDADGLPVAELVSDYQVSEDGRFYKLLLKKNVLFHSGVEMTATDVVESIRRYSRVGFDKRIVDGILSVSADSRYRVSIVLQEPDPSFIWNISSPRAPLVIMPSDEARKTGTSLQLIGTGPFIFDSWVPDSYILLKRFDEYRSAKSASNPDGLAGNKVAFVDSVRIRTIPESGSQLAALQAQEVDLLKSISSRSAQRISEKTTIKTYRQAESEMLLATLNSGSGATQSLNVRKAIQAALDCREIMEIGTDGLYNLNHSLNYTTSPFWSAGYGEDLYNQADIDQARRLLRQSGYGGEQVIVLAHTAANSVYRTSVVIYEQLRRMGMNVTLRVVDFPLALNTVQYTDSWNIWVNNFGIGPWLGTTMLPRYWVGKQSFQNHFDPKLDELYDDLLASNSLENQRLTASKLQQYLYSNAYVLKLGDSDKLLASSQRVNGFSPYMIMRFWGIWLSDGIIDQESVSR